MDQHSSASHPASGFVTHSGFALIELLGALALTGILIGLAYPMVTDWMHRWHVIQSRARFERDWRWARWSAQQSGQVIRLQSLDHCHASRTAGWSCGWQTRFEATGQLLNETLLPAGLTVDTKPSGSWRIDAWGEPLSGGASIVFQAGTDAAPATELLCMNVAGRLRRIQGNSCSD